MHFGSVLPLSLLLLVACSDDSDDSSNASAVKACQDIADAVASSAQRCGMDYQESYDTFVEAASAGSCNNIFAVRDEQALRNECIPYINGMTCEQLNSASVTLPESCKEQLYRQQGADLTTDSSRFDTMGLTVQAQ